MNQINVEAALHQLYELANVCPEVTTTDCYQAAIDLLSEKRVYAIWEVDELPKRLADIHISGGIAEFGDGGKTGQFEGYSPDSPGAELSIKRFVDERDRPYYQIEFSADSRGFEKEPNYWISPDPIGDRDAGGCGIK
ncbi:MAG: hypothetical protein ACK4S4_15700 [Pyrinomonadaceae bacterium]